MDVEVRIKAIEERLSEVESAQRNEGSAMRSMFTLVQRIDTNMTVLVARTQALETNFSLLNARVDGIDKKVDVLDTKFDVLDKKVDQILALMRSSDGSQPQ